MGEPQTTWQPFSFDGSPQLIAGRLAEPAEWEPTHAIIDGDLFHPDVPDETIADVFATITRCEQHTFRVTTEHPDRMARMLLSAEFPHSVARSIDRLEVRSEIERMGPEEQRPIEGHPGYWVTDRGRVLLEGGSETCVWCGEPIPPQALARTRYCSQKCNSKVHYEISQGRWVEPQTFRELRPDRGQQGHLRVALGDQRRHLVHRLVLSAFVRPATDPNEQCCHRDGDSGNNALPNLRWGTQSDNWADRKRHGNGRAHALPGTPPTVDHAALGFTWPLPNCWVGVTIESGRHGPRSARLAQITGWHHFLSIDPLVGPLTAAQIEWSGVGCVIVGGESGPNARPMHPNWLNDIYQHCERPSGERHKIPFEFKQWGEWTIPTKHLEIKRVPSHDTIWLGDNGVIVRSFEEAAELSAQRVVMQRMERTGKHNAGRVWIGREWNGSVVMSPQPAEALL